MRKYSVPIALLMLAACGPVDPQKRGYMTTVTCTIGGCEKTLESKRQNLNRAEAENTGLAAQADQKEMTRNAVSGQRASLEKQYAGLKSDIQNLQKKLSRKKLGNSPQAQELSELEDEVTLRQQGGASQAELDQLTHKKESLEKQIKILLRG